MTSRMPDLVLIQGPESVLADRALAATLADLRGIEPDLEVVRITGSTYEPGSLAVHASPSLFGGSTCIVVADLDEATDELQLDLLAYLAAPAEGVWLVVLHKSGNRGKKVLDTLKKAGARVIEVAAVKTDADKIAFIQNEFRTARRKATPEAVRALHEALGKDLRELAAACAQLVADTEGVIDESVVETYYGGKVEATGFKVADAAIAGNTAEALRLMRHALASGDNPVPMVAVLALKLRQLVKVGSAGRGPSGQLAKSLGMAPWQIDRARKELSGWDPEALGRSIQAVAAADYDIKGGSRDAVYALEKALLAIARERRGGTR